MKRFFLSLFSAILGVCLAVGLIACKSDEDTNQNEEMLQISAVSKELEVGETFTLTATSQPDGEVTFSTSNAEVASVTQTGVVTGVSVGTAEITLSVDGQSATCTVTVTQAEQPQAPLTFLVDEMRVRVGGTPKTLSVLYENTLVQSGVTFQTANAEIATVDNNGQLNGVKKGETMITAIYGEFTAQLKVIVDEFVIVAMQTEKTYIKPQESVTLTAKVFTGVEQTETDSTGVEWTIDKPEVAEVTV